LNPLAVRVGAEGTGANMAFSGTGPIYGPTIYGPIQAATRDWTRLEEDLYTVRFSLSP